MTDPIPADQAPDDAVVQTDPPVLVEDNPAKPWKAIAALVAPAVVAFLQSILDQGRDSLPPWLLLLLGALASAAGVYVIRNPKRKRVLARDRIPSAREHRRLREQGHRP